MTALETILRIATEAGVAITDEQRIEIDKRVAQELGGSPHYFAKRLHPGFVTAYMRHTQGMSVREQVDMVKTRFGASTRTAYRWVTKR